jgi:hypothetical protein
MKNVGLQGLEKQNQCGYTQAMIIELKSYSDRANDIKIPFILKILYDPAGYIRLDSAVLKVEKNNYQAIKPILKTTYTENQSHFQPEIPLLTKQLAPGLSIAEEPTEKFSPQESFGMNRCQIVAKGLIASWLRGDRSSESRVDQILQSFSFHKTYLKYPYLNI